MPILRSIRYVLPQGMGALLLVLLALPGQAAERYYLMVFGSQLDQSQPRYTHSFAVFVKATGEGLFPEHYALEAHTISWMPRALEIHLARLCPERGVNLGLHETIRYVLGEGERISYWGPYEIEPELYCRALRQIAVLNSGEVAYKAVDTGYPTDRASNCIHAITSTVGGYRVRVIIPSYGETASFIVTRRLSPWIVDADREYAWVRKRLGLDCYPMIHRELFVNPRTGVIRGFFRPWLIQ